MTALLVYNVEPASPSMIASLDRHCRERKPDGVSAIDRDRSHLNRKLIGSDLGIHDSLEMLYEQGVKRAAQQAEKPFLRIVVSASPEYFRPDDPTAAGTWDEDRLEAWLAATMAQLRAEHGDDLVYAELHLDEDTPHIHAVVAPTYKKKPRRPGRQKRGETPEEFAARRAAAEIETGERVVGRASHPELSKPGSFQRLRERMAVALDHLGIQYGEDRYGQADAKMTRQWVKKQAVEIRRKQKELEAQAKVQVAQQSQLRLDQLALERKAACLEAQRADVVAREAEIQTRSAAVTVREAQIEKRETALAAREITVLERESDLSKLAKELESCERAVERASNGLDSRAAILAEQQARIEADGRELDARERKLDAMLETVRSLIGRVAGIVKVWADELCLTVPGPIKTVQELRAQLDKIEDDNRDRIELRDLVPDPDPYRDGPAF